MRALGRPAGAPAALMLPLSLPQVHGSLLEALAAAAAPAKAELALVALPAAKDGQPQQAGSPSLASALLVLATALLKAAGLSLKRCAAVSERLPLVAAAAAATDAGGAPAGDAAALQAALQAAVAPAVAAVEAGKQQAAGVAGKLALAGEDEAVPSLAAAQAAYAAFHALQQAVAAEALAAATSLRLQEGKAAEGGGLADGAADGGAPAAAPGGGGKKKEKKKDKGAPAGMQLGKGTALLRAYVEDVAAGGSPATAEEDALEARLERLDLGAAADVGAALAAALPAVAGALDPLGHQLQLHLGTLRGVIEANQVWQPGGCCVLCCWRPRGAAQPGRPARGLPTHRARPLPAPPSPAHRRGASPRLPRARATCSQTRWRSERARLPPSPPCSSATAPCPSTPPCLSSGGGGAGLAGPGALHGGARRGAAPGAAASLQPWQRTPHTRSARCAPPQGDADGQVRRGQQADL